MQGEAIEDGCIYDLAIGCVFQNEAPYLKEWLEFHRMLGVQRFVLVNDRSSDNFEEVLQPYLADGSVQLLNGACAPDWQRTKWPDYQCAVLRAIVNNMRGVARWLALVDVDEFLVPYAANDLVEFLAAYEHCGAVYVHWEPFGTSHVAKLGGSELLTESLYLKWRFIRGYDMLGKSIVKPHRVLRANIHRCEILPGFEYVDCNPDMERDEAVIKLHHYWARDEHFLLHVKLPRTSRIKGWQIDEAGIRYFKALFNDVPDYTMRKFAPQLRARLFPS